MKAKAPKVKVSNLLKHEERVAWLFVAAPFMQFFLFSLIPIVFSLVVSFSDYNINFSLDFIEFVGFSNYIEIFKDKEFYAAVFNTIFYMIGIPIGMALALIIATAMNRNIPGIRVFRTIYYIPVVSSLVAVSILWRYIYNGDSGLLNAFLSIFGIDGPSWLYDPATVKPALILMMVWRGLGSSIVLYLAGLQNIPPVYYEAAEIDGANSFVKFRRITLPLITPISFYIIITSVIGGLQLFTEINIMIAQVNDDVRTIVTYLYDKAFVSSRMGYASAVAWILAIAICIITIIQFKYQHKWVHNMDD